eukprot:3802016-Amphidinium_carterae.2
MPDGRSFLGLGSVDPAYHKIRDQTVVEGTGGSADIMLSEAVHAHNILTTKGGFTPHEAVFGRTLPALMMDTEETSHEALTWGEHSLDHIARVLEVAVRSMIESLTEDRIRRAEKSARLPRTEVRRSRQSHSLAGGC